MVVDPDAILCRRHPILHSQQHLRSHVQEHGHAQRHIGPVHQPALPPMGYKTPMEPLCGHNKKQEVVDNNDAAAYVLSNADAAVPSATDNR